jgi:hypothetical protein
MEEALTHREPAAPIEDSMFMERLRTTEASTCKEEVPSIRQRSHQRPSVHPVLRLQQSLGNHAVQCLLRERAIQGKLQINQSGDVYEQEANRVAHTVMRMSSPAADTPVVQHLCSTSEKETQRQPAEKEEEEELLHAKEVGRTPVMTPSVPSEIASMQSSGRPLPASERVFFEPRFGPGLGLLRARLSIQREDDEKPAVAPGFELEGLYPDAPKVRNRIFFERNNPMPPESESFKLDDLAETIGEQRVTLRAYASEDEVGTGGAGFALARGIVVKDMLAKLKPGAAIEVQALPEASAGEIDYRYWRSVQFVIGEAPPGDDERRPKEWECTSQFLGDLKTQAGGYLGTALKNYSDEKYKGAIATLFTDSFPETVAKVKGNIDKIHAKLTGELDLRCALPGDEHCSIEGSARAYANQREGYIVVCPSDPAKRSERDLLNLIHEVAHITPEVMTDDFAYSWEPLIGFLPQVIALRNTDSYTLLIRAMHDGSDTVAMPRVRTIASDFANEAENQAIKEALSWVKTSIVETPRHIYALYEAVTRALSTPPGWSGRDAPYRVVYERFTPLFQLTPLGAGGPTPEDQWKLAGVYDRMKAVADKLPASDAYYFHKDASVASVRLVVEDGRLGRLHAHPDYPRQSQGFRIAELVVSVFAESRGLSPELRDAYRLALGVVMRFARGIGLPGAE